MDARSADAEKRSSRTEKLMRDVVIVVLLMLVTQLVRTVTVQMFAVPSASMEPTLCGGADCRDGNDRILVNKLSYRFGAQVDRGDLVVFNTPTALAGLVPEKTLVKRVVAVSGDTVRWDKADLWINGRLQHESYLNPACEGIPEDLTGSALLSTGQLFVLGDNRCNSVDSRQFGAVSTESVVGGVILIVWPLSRVGSP